VLEASSHSLAMDRLWGCHFQAAVFTNLTREHMDFHKTFEDYFAAKKRLFEGTGAGTPEVAVVNADDEFGKRLAGLAKKTVTYGLESDADITTKKFQLTFDGLTFTAHTPNGKVHLVSRLVGRINVYNLLAAIGAAQALGLSNDAIENGIRNLESVSGRFQRIDLGQPFLVIVDYAHTDDALENLIRTARELNPKGRIITLFGCGGEKDRTKRPVMGEVTGRLSDLTILSSDNPRSEDPLKIISDIIVGLQKTAGKLRTETKVVVSTESESTSEVTTASEIQNPNDEIALTYVYSKLQRQYEVFASLAEVANIVMVAEPVPLPEQVTLAWIKRHDWMIAQALLDDSYRDTLSGLSQDVEPSDAGSLSADMKSAMDTSLGHLGALALNTGIAINQVDVAQEAERGYQEAVKSQAEAARQRNQIQRNRQRLIQHVCDNILHYCRAIWSHEDPDQRLLRYRRAGIVVPTRFRFVGNAGGGWGAFSKACGKARFSAAFHRPADSIAWCSRANSFGVLYPSELCGRRSL